MTLNSFLGNYFQQEGVVKLGDDFFEKFAELCEKQDILIELNTVDGLKGYNYS